MSGFAGQAVVEKRADIVYVVTPKWACEKHVPNVTLMLCELLG